jgi:hypothetical protein
MADDHHATAPLLPAPAAGLGNVPTLPQPPAHEQARLAQGFAWVFWGTFALLGAAAELMLAPTLRLFPALIGAVGAAGVCRGAWCLQATPSLGRAWQQRVRGLVLSAGLTAYLTPFCWLWRQVPTNRYFLCHALAWGGTFLIYLVMANECIRLFGRATGHRSLVFQASLFSVTTVLVLFLPFLFLAQALVRLTWAGNDPLEALQFALAHLPAVLVFVMLAPVSLTMSLVWAARDLALTRLTTPPANPMLGSTQS